MATNVTKDSIEYFERRLKNEEIHLEKAIQRWENAKVKLAQRKAENPNKYADRPDLDEESTEIINCRKICAHYRIAIEAIKEKDMKDNGIVFDNYLELRNRNYIKPKNKLINNNKKPYKKVRK